MKILFFIAPLFGALVFSPAYCQQEFPRPHGYVSDYPGILQPANKSQLELLCREIASKASLELAFVIMDSIPEGQDISLYAVELGHAWGVGAAGTDRGALVLYKTGKYDGKRQVYLATGYGLEGYIPDAKAGRILDEVTIPGLRDGLIFEAFAATALTIVGIVEPDVKITGSVNERRIMRSRGKQRSPIGFFIMLAIVFLLMSSRGGRGLLFGVLLGSMMFGRGGGWGSGGGGFGGGFGGFGGGGFGGGGAGRSF